MNCCSLMPPVNVDVTRLVSVNVSVMLETTGEPLMVTVVGTTVTLDVVTVTTVVVGACVMVDTVWMVVGWRTVVVITPGDPVSVLVTKIVVTVVVPACTIVDISVTVVGTSTVDVTT